MRQIREILRQKWTLGLSHRAIARSLGIGLGTISSVLTRAQGAGLDWPQAQPLSEAVLEGRLYGRPDVAGQRQRPAPDCAWIHAERRRPGVTLELLHLEYLERHPDGYRYTRFCDLYRAWLARRRLSMRQVHRAGEKCFVDYAGQKPRLIDPMTGVVAVELFVAALGASNYTYAEATRTQQVPDWIASHVRAFAFFGGVPAAVVCDQLKSGVVLPCRYEPGLQRTYEEWAQHYGTAILPARPAKPRDKAKIEAGVLVVERWILARLRHETFFSLGALNARIAELLAALNTRLMRLYGASRRQLFERLDQPALRSLPPEPFVYGEWQVARVNIDYHVEVHRHYYSVPYPLLHEGVDARVSATTVELFHRGERVAAHLRDDTPGRHTTNSAHMPKAHQHHLEWTPSRLIQWADTIGPQTAALVTAILADRPHPEQGYRSCLGLLRLSRRDGVARLEAACARVMVPAHRDRPFRSLLIARSVSS